MFGKVISLVAAGIVLLSPAAQARSKAQKTSPSQGKGDQNQGQDRVIKKKSFRKDDVSGAIAVPNKELGLFAIVTPDQLNDQALLKSLLANPTVNGLSAVVTWRSLEPEESKFHWQQIDDALSLCAAANKSLILRVSTCAMSDSDTPAWVFQAGAKSAPFVKADGGKGVMPIFWDTTYLARWANLVNAMGSHFDNNANLHSVGITGGGMLGGTQVVPNFAGKTDYKELETRLKDDHGMSQQQLVQHWKYVADLFAHAFTSTRLNFDIDPPTPNRAGENSLDEISDYLVYRYGERICLTRQNVADAKHGFDQYRVILKFKTDTLTGYQLAADLNARILEKLEKFALDDGTSYIEVPGSYFTDKNEAIAKILEDMRSRLGFQLVSEKISIPADIKVGEKLKASFSFVNRGSAPAMRPDRQFDKDVASSYRIQVELRNSADKPMVISYHTPSLPTNKWLAGRPVVWEEELTMPQLKPGQYQVFVSVVDSHSNRKIQFLDAITSKNPKPEFTVAAGKLQVVAQ